MARIVLHLENLDEVDTAGILRKLGDDVADDMRRFAPTDDFQLREAIHVAEVTDEHAIISADPRNPESSAEHKPYGYFVATGTSDTPANPFMQRATYIYRS